MSHRLSIPFMIIAIAASCSIAAAQAGGGQQSRGSFNPDRLFENDANEDGKLTRDELPPRMADRIFDRMDANGDDVLDREEVEAFFARRGAGGRDGARGGAGGGAGERSRGAGRAQNTFESSMKAMGRAMGRFGRSELNAESRARDLDVVTALQASIVGAKGKVGTVKPSEAAEAKYGDDIEAYLKAFRLQMLNLLVESLTLERAILSGDAAAARSSLETLKALQERGHDLFMHEDDGHKDQDARKSGSNEDPSRTRRAGPSGGARGIGGPR